MFFLALYLVIGVLAGLLAGLLGVGGGAIAVPLLVWAFELQGFPLSIATHMALATSLAAMVATSTSSMAAHSRRGAVVWSIVKYMGAGVVIGSALGVITAVNIPGNLLQLAFAAFLLLVSFQVLSGFRPLSTQGMPGPLGLGMAGGVIGWLSMYFGIGGGSVTVPFLCWFNTSPQKAVGTSAALGLPIALLGAGLYMVAGWRHSALPMYSAGYIYLPAAFSVALSSVFFAKLGAATAHKLSPALLKLVFGSVLLLISLRMLWVNVT